MFLLAATIFALHGLSYAQTSAPESGAGASDSLTNVTMAFTTAQVVPDVVSSFSPRVGVDVLFTDPVTSDSIQVIPGALLTMEQTQSAPQYSLSSNTSDLSMSNVSWVIAIVDPDAPTPQNPNISQFLHFIGQDFVVDNSSIGMDAGNMTALTNLSQPLVDFFPPTPPAGSDPHRYVVLVYVQPDDFNTTASSFLNGTIDDTDTSFRMNFSLSDFATSASLGDPVAGNFFLVGPGQDASTLPSSSSEVFPTPTEPVSIFSEPPPEPTETDTPDVNTSGATKSASVTPLVVLGTLITAIGLVA